MGDDDSNGRDGPNNPEKHNLTGKNTPKTKDNKNTQADHTDPTQTLVTTDPTKTHKQENCCNTVKEKFFDDALPNAKDPRTGLRPYQ